MKGTERVRNEWRLVSSPPKNSCRKQLITLMASKCYLSWKSKNDSVGRALNPQVQTLIKPQKIILRPRNQIELAQLDFKIAWSTWLFYLLFLPFWARLFQLLSSVCPMIAFWDDMSTDEEIFCYRMDYVQSFTQLNLDDLGNEICDFQPDDI